MKDIFAANVPEANLIIDLDDFPDLARWYNAIDSRSTGATHSPMSSSQGRSR
jgi:hypothetical protein